ncbi:nucleoside triphosphate hydrolase protein [Wolfiporia cocos MD-104 SS10]|uniref:Nucleoside triphosphate hydrolase protein n=1 Tax=Wolfiporia cocos (strain MD-104) TaxID=742152 RepID=A0A2H3JJN5_WOLCO|nr:nucleoside triphosphate hydrolase protein [Wolfiporia cocos MD-104 SS10]
MAKQNNRVLISQSLFRAQYDPFVVTSVNESELTVDCVASFLQTATKGGLGIASSHGPKGVLTFLAVSTPTNCLYIRMAAPSTKSKDKKKVDKTSPSGRTILQAILSHSDYRKLAFDMHSIAAALHLDHALAITEAIDLQSLVFWKPRGAPATMLYILGGADKLYERNVSDAFRGEAFDAATMQNVCLRAWASCQTAFNPKLERHHQAAQAIDTFAINKQDLNAICKFIRDAERLHALKPTRVKNDVAPQFSFKSDALELGMTRFKTRMRTSYDQQLFVEFEHKNRPNTSASGRVEYSHGKTARVTVNAVVPATSTIRSIYTIGKDAPTPAEWQRLLVSLYVLQRKVSLREHAISRKIFVPSSADLASPITSVNPPCTAAVTVPFPLNQSQLKAARKILSNDVSLIYGPPGTGKTTVIAAVVMALAPTLTDKEGIWLVAHSNVAVKNIAEKLARVGFLDFKLLVSEDFHYEWHEHLYTTIERNGNVIRSDEIGQDPTGTARLLLDSKVILCTLAMVSNHRIKTAGFMRLVPITTVIVDEASQIELGCYLPLLCDFGHTIRRIAFIGDDKQLAPYGQDDLGTLDSVFELKHLRKSSVFLDTQYRMPAPIGDFISRHIYGGKLKSNHLVTSPLSCRLVDVRNGKEQKASGSWMNEVEANVVIAIAKKLHARGKVYRIITPYDAQRNLLEKKLKSAEIPWEDKCFNVDSFQGKYCSEDDHIIISVVRSEKVGFLTNLRRTNVMLSRCKQSMIICTSRAFLEQKAPKTLIGKLAAEWGQSSWISVKDILAGNL